LFGRLSAAEQQRVFSPSGRRKIIVATNIAETSLTLPGIRYVVDAGLARLSRYNPRTRTRRLPIEPISQSSAEQRRGRSGRVQNGICVRLYSEEDHLERPRFTQPEIQRANLAEVILRMKAFRLGEIETFPFLNPPHPGAIQSGYKVLQELGALNEQRDLTPLGAELARLPVDPVVGRMILEARKEKAVHEVAVIAAALSIQDPRERPLDRASAADEAHRKFVDPYSDFLTLLNVWDEYHAQWETLKTQNQLRKFCQSHFLSYMRMREWRDVHAQIMAILEEDNRFQENAAPAPYEAIHRSILSGLLGQVAQRKEKNLYQAGGGRLVRIFPGSGLFAKNGHEKRKNPNPDEPSSSQPEWLMSAEIVETSQLFARTVAWIEPQWIAEIGSHLCRSTFHEAHWRGSAGRVVVLEKVMLHGLTVLERWIDYGKVDPVKATELFIRALVENQVQLPHKFLAHNQQARQRLEVWQTRMRQAAHCDLDQAFFNFYQNRLHHISSIPDLNKLLRDKLMHDPQFLCAGEEELTGEAAVALDREAYPAQVKLANQSVDVSYAYAPGEEQDGVTLRLPVEIARAIAPEEIRWLVPGLREEQVLHLLRLLPKAVRIKLMPLDRAAAEIARELGHQISPAQLSEFLAKRRHVHVPDAAWQFDSLPLHLQTRIEITRGKSGKVLAAGRELKLLQQQLKNEECSIEQELWRQAARQWERYELRGWTLGDVPEKVRVGQLNDVEVWGFPGLHLENEQVNLRLFRRKEEALLASHKGFPRLLEFGLQKEFAWIEKDLRGLDKLKELFITLGPADLLRASALAHLRRLLFQFPAEPFELKQTIYEQALESARRKIPGLIPRLLEQIENILRARQEVLLCRKPLPEMRRHLDSLVPPSFLESTPPERLPHLPRYLKALLLRAERAAINPLKDREKQALTHPFNEALSKLQKISATGDSRQKAEEFRWLLEEYKVSVFAQELGTSQPVSQKRLQSLLPSNG
jgi:ATP-dependent helicase HrpA